MWTRCTALNFTKGLLETWWNRGRTEETTVTVQLLTRLLTAIQIFYHQLKIISTWHTHTTNLHGCLHARQIPLIHTPDFSHTYRGRGNESSYGGNDSCHGFPIYSRILYIQLEMFLSPTTRLAKPSTRILVLITMRQYLVQRFLTFSVPWDPLTD
jgi:hypothetical protein